MEGCFKFQWGGLFFRWGGASFLSGEAPHAGGIDLDGGGFEKKCRMGGGHSSLLWETLRLPCVEHSDF